MVSGLPQVRRNVVETHLLEENIAEKEGRYIDELLRGLYAKRELPEGYKISNKSISEDFYLAIPLT